MRVLIIILIVCNSIGVFCQGIKFESITWKQVLEKAKLEKRYVFIDCYASWCSPCKRMDNEIYTNEIVGSFMNKNFVSVKMQMDTAKSDNDQVRSWYPVSHEIFQKNKIFIYPTYLILNPDGKIVHRDVGFKNSDEFLLFARNGLSPSRQFYTLLEEYKRGVVGYYDFPYLAKIGQSIGETELANHIASEYITGFLDKQKEDSLYKIEIFSFIGSFYKALTSKSKIFSIYLKGSGKVDTIMKEKGYSQKYVDYVISKEEITPLVKAAKEDKNKPDWDNISKSIENKYGFNFVERNVLSAKISYYRSEKDWKNYTKCLIKKIEQSNLIEASTEKAIVLLNNSVMEIFFYSDDRGELIKALSWSNCVIEYSDINTLPNSMDTKASVLYKLGNIEDAIALEERAASMAPTNKNIQEVLEKMKKREIFWVIPVQ